MLSIHSRGAPWTLRPSKGSTSELPRAPESASWGADHDTVLALGHVCGLRPVLGCGTTQPRVGKTLDLQTGVQALLGELGVPLGASTHSILKSSTQRGPVGVTTVIGARLQHGAWHMVSGAVVQQTRHASYTLCTHAHGHVAGTGYIHGKLHNTQHATRVCATFTRRLVFETCDLLTSCPSRPAVPDHAGTPRPGLASWVLWTALVWTVSPFLPRPQGRPHVGACHSS